MARAPKMMEDMSSDQTNHSPNGCSLPLNKAFVAVHSGAGIHSEVNDDYNKRLCRMACLQAMRLLTSNISAIDAATAAVEMLENDDLTNAGYGANLTVHGTVECEAAVMDGESLHFGAVGVLSEVKNPVKVANILVKEQIEGPLSYGRVKPSVLVGKGARLFCNERGIDTNCNMLTKHALKTYNRFKRKCKLTDEETNPNKKRKVEPDKKEDTTTKEENVGKPSHSTFDDRGSVQDTVGAICVDQAGNVAAAGSSGGIWLKHPGRLGPVATYGAGCWAQNMTDTKPGVAVATSGCGEHIMQTLLAKTCADGIRSSAPMSESLHNVFTKEFMYSEFLTRNAENMAGVLALKLTNTSGTNEDNVYCNSLPAVELSWIHSTDSFCLAFLGGDEISPKGVMSRRDNSSFAMGGHFVFL